MGQEDGKGRPFGAWSLFSQVNDSTSEAKAYIIVLPLVTKECLIHPQTQSNSTLLSIASVATDSKV